MVANIYENIEVDKTVDDVEVGDFRELPISITTSTVTGCDCERGEPPPPPK